MNGPQIDWLASMLYAMENTQQGVRERLTWIVVFLGIIAACAVVLTFIAMSTPALAIGAL